jgi:predicted PurR-regulated permease PerM
VGKSLTPVAVQFVKNPETFVTWLHDLPYYQELMAYEEELKNKIADSIETAGGFLVGGLSQVALGTANLLFMSLVFLYTFFFFQLDGHKTIHAILYYLPLEDRVERRLLTKFTLVTQAMIKGTLLIGILQGALAGIAFAVAGVPHSVFWGTVMAVLSIVPGIGSAVVWVPASIILIVQGNIIAGIGLILFCALIVGSIDNVLRPILVGKDTNMHELMIFFGTMGGLFTFGMAGLLIGPVIASLFLTIWEIYGEAFRDVLPAVGDDTAALPGKALSKHANADDLAPLPTSEPGASLRRRRKSRRVAPKTPLPRPRQTHDRPKGLPGSGCSTAERRVPARFPARLPEIAAAILLSWGKLGRHRCPSLRTPKPG